MGPVTLAMLLLAQSVIIVVVWFVVRASGRRALGLDKRSRGSTRTIEIGELRKMLAGLTSITEMLHRDVGDHTTEVDDINRGLAAHLDDDDAVDEPVRWIARIIDANTKLKRQLAESDRLLKEQERKLNSYMMMASTDPLTGLANRRAFSENLDGFLFDRRRKRFEMGLIMFDLNGFKAVNDEHGHLVGDRLLRGVSRVLSYCIRERDILARFGGDEFALILEHCCADDAMQIAERARLAVASSSFRVDDHLLKVTVSVGLAMADGDTTADSILKRADAALYASKNNGTRHAFIHTNGGCKAIAALQHGPDPKIFKV